MCIRSLVLTTVSIDPLKININLNYI